MRDALGARGNEIHGPYRKIMAGVLADPDSPESGVYRRRCMIESTNFMIKHLTGSSVTARSTEGRCRQALIKVLAFNTFRTVSLGRSWMLELRFNETSSRRQAGVH